MVPKPIVAKSLVNSANTPYGASSIKMPTIFMTITSMSRNQLAIRSPASPDRVRAKPTSSANTITCSIWPSAIALKGLLGKILTSVSVSGGGALAS